MKYFLITYGCQMNKSDSERIATVLESANHKPAQKIEQADLVVVNMCSVRQSAVDRIYGLAQKLKNLKTKKQGLKTVLTGCILKKDKRKFEKKFNLILDIKDLPKFSKKLSIPCSDMDVGKKRNGDYLKIQPKYQNNFSAFVPISNGCNNFCAYCVVPFTRGSLICRDHKEILNEIRCLIKKGYKEIWLLGQNVNDYQSPTNSLINFAKILEMSDNIPGDFKILFTSPNPKNFSEELINVLAKCKKFGKRLNLPVQAGDDKTLKKMNRPYGVSRYKRLVKKIRGKIPDINLSTDVIVGFPGETKKQFNNTVKLFKEIRFNIAYIAKYSPRPGTAAFKMKDNVSVKEKKRREKILMDFVKNHE